MESETAKKLRLDVIAFDALAKQMESTSLHIKCNAIRIDCYVFNDNAMVYFFDKGTYFVGSMKNIRQHLNGVHIETSGVMKAVFCRDARADPILCLYLTNKCTKLVKEAIEMDELSDTPFSLLAEKARTRIFVRFHEMTMYHYNYLRQLWNFIEEIDFKSMLGITRIADSCDPICKQESDSIMGPKVEQITIYSDKLLALHFGEDIVLKMADILCLEKNNAINSTIVNFYFKWISRNVVPPQMRCKTHFYDTQFYQDMNNLYLPKIKGIDNASYISAQAKETQYQQFLENYNPPQLFDNEFILIPVSFHNRWFLLVICYPMMNTLIRRDTDMDISYIDDDNAPIKCSCVLQFGSYMEPDRELTTRLLYFLNRAYTATLKGKPPTHEFNCLNLPFERIKTPPRPKDIDSGLCMLKNAKNFFEDPIEDFTLPFESMDEWYDGNTVPQLREDIAIIIQNELDKYYYPTKRVLLPKLVFPTKNGRLLRADPAIKIKIEMDGESNDSSFGEEILSDSGSDAESDLDLDLADA